MAAGSTRTLLLLRHAKAVQDLGLVDHARPLSERGRRDAGAVGRTLAERWPALDLVLCSTAVRTRQTWAQAVQGGASAAEVRYLDDIYDAPAGRLLQLVRALPAPASTAVVVGHGPGVPELADLLTPGDTFARTTSRYPTSGLAVLAWDGGWPDADVGVAELMSFEVPRGQLGG